MRKNGLTPGILSILLVFMSCTEDKDALTKEDICSRTLDEICVTDGSLKADKDSVEWVALQCGAEYHEPDGYFLLYADKFGAYETGNQIILKFNGANTNTFTVNSNIQAQYNFVVGGDSGYFPYDIDSSYHDNVIEITNLDTKNQIIEGRFTIRLKRDSFHENTEFKEYVQLTNGSFKMKYCVFSDQPYGLLKE